MKKILSVLAVLAVASGVVFAADYFGTNGNNFKLQTTIADQPHVFYLSTKADGEVLADNTVVEENVDLTKAGSYKGVSLWLAAGGNQNAAAEYTIEVADTDFAGVKNSEMKVLTEVSLDTTTISVPAGPTAKAKKATVTVDWRTGNPNLPADTYVDTITVTVKKN